MEDKINALTQSVESIKLDLNKLIEAVEFLLEHYGKESSAQRDNRLAAIQHHKNIHELR